MDPNYGATGVRFPTQGKVWAVNLPDNTPVVINLKELGMSGRWMTLRTTGNAAAYFFRAEGSTETPDLTARDTFDDNGILKGDKSAKVCEELAADAESEPGFVAEDAPVLVVVSSGGGVLRLKDAQVQ